MDDDEEYVDNRDEVLAKFREQLGKPISERFFDEDFLLDVFDFAGDIQNDYLRMEAMMCLARFYPDSEFFQERRGIFYSQYSDEARAAFLSDNPDAGNMIIDILRVKELMPEGEEAKSALDGLIARYDHLSDEEIIQFVDLASSLGQLQWLKDNMKMLMRKCDNANVLPYEVAIAADTHHDNAFAIELLEGLTQSEPFNSYFWMSLARQYFEINEGEKALSAVDYSLAINPDAPLSLLAKARILYAMEKPLDEVLPLLKKATALDPGNIDIARYSASVYFAENMPEKSRQAIIDAIDNGAPELELIPDLLAYGAGNADELFDRYYKLNDDNTQVMWASWAQQLSMQGFTDLAKKALACYERNAGEKIPSIFAIEDEFIAKNFKKAVEYLDQYIKGLQANEMDFPSVLAIHLISMVKTGEITKAAALCDFIQKNIDATQYSSVAHRLEFVGVMAIVANFKRRLAEKPLASDWESWDPLAFW
ncbi:MAG: hypothetical protein NC102_02540 [Clostridium sp.]|nr:hypothetical protein [Clostridium sp.]